MLPSQEQHDHCKTFARVLSHTDIDECSSEPCENNATCTNIPGSFNCTGEITDSKDHDDNGLSKFL